MANKQVSKKISKGDAIWSDGRWAVKSGELKRPAGHPGVANLFRFVCEKIPFDALRDLEQLFKAGDRASEGVYVAHDSMGYPRYVGRGQVFARLKARKKQHPYELRLFSFYLVKDKKHEREIETLLIHAAGPLLHFNDRKVTVGIEAGDIKDFEAGTVFVERQMKKGKKPKAKAP